MSFSLSYVEESRLKDQLRRRRWKGTASDEKLFNKALAYIQIDQVGFYTSKENWHWLEERVKTWPHLAEKVVANLKNPPTQTQSTSHFAMYAHPLFESTWQEIFKGLLYSSQDLSETLEFWVHGRRFDMLEEKERNPFVTSAIHTLVMNAPLEMMASYFQAFSQGLGRFGFLYHRESLQALLESIPQRLAEMKEGEQVAYPAFQKQWCDYFATQGRQLLSVWAYPIQEPHVELSQAGMGFLATFISEYVAAIVKAVPNPVLYLPNHAGETHLLEVLDAYPLYKEAFENAAVFAEKMTLNLALPSTASISISLKTRL